MTNALYNRIDAIEAFAAERRGLGGRALRREQDEVTAGWWLYDQWLLKAESGSDVNGPRGLDPDLFHRLWKTIRICHFRHGLRLGPGRAPPNAS
jgi:hypothetical protein